MNQKSSFKTEGNNKNSPRVLTQISSEDFMKLMSKNFDKNPDSKIHHGLAV